MKNPTILKDELSLLRADKSVVLTELRNKGKELKKVQEELFKLEKKLADVKTEIREESARLSETKGRAVSVKAELTDIQQQLKNLTNSHDTLKARNSQEEKNHLGRIKELKEEEADVLERISNLKKLFDNNSKVFTSHQSERQNQLRILDADWDEKTKALKELSETVEKKRAEDKKLTKERLKREDKLKAKEKRLEAKEYSLQKREEDLITMSKDMSIVYGRLKEIWAKTNPDIDLDKLILNAI